MIVKVMILQKILAGEGQWSINYFNLSAHCGSILKPYLESPHKLFSWHVIVTLKLKAQVVYGIVIGVSDKKNAINLLTGQSLMF